MKLAVTGGTGFVGQAVLDEAARRGIAIRALARKDQAARKGVEWIKGDLAATDALAELAHGANAVLHIAGVVNAPDKAGFLAGNVEGTEAVCSAARGAGVSRILHVSSLAAREPGISDYGYSKMLAEEVVQTSGLDWTIVRPPAVYGPRDTEIFELFKAARWGFVPMPPPGRTSIIHVADLARLMIDLLVTSTNTTGRIFEPDDGTPEGWSHKELARNIGQAMGRKVWAPNISASVLNSAARLDRMFRGKKAKLTPDRAGYMSHPDWVSSPKHAVPQEIWCPAIETPTGLAETAKWYDDNDWL